MILAVFLLVQSRIVVTRPPLIFRALHQPFPHGIQLFQLLSPKGATYPALRDQAIGLGYAAQSVSTREP
jgi:hypothetical protein